MRAILVTMTLAGSGTRVSTAVIARCMGTADVVAAVNYARERNLLTAIRGGGHNVGGRVRVQGGATLGDLDRETRRQQLSCKTRCELRVIACEASLLKADRLKAWV